MALWVLAGGPSTICHLSRARPIASFATDLHRVPLPVTHAHCAQLAALPLHHRDPFDRMLVAQALSERWPLVTADPLLVPYGAPIVW